MFDKASGFDPKFFGNSDFEKKDSNEKGLTHFTPQNFHILQFLCFSETHHSEANSYGKIQNNYRKIINLSDFESQTLQRLMSNFCLISSANGNKTFYAINAVILGFSGLSCVVGDCNWPRKSFKKGDGFLFRNNDSFFFAKHFLASPHNQIIVGFCSCNRVLGM